MERERYSGRTRARCELQVGREDGSGGEPGHTGSPLQPPELGAELAPPRPGCFCHSSPSRPRQAAEDNVDGTQEEQLRKSKKPDQGNSEQQSGAIGPRVDALWTQPWDMVIHRTAHDINTTPSAPLLPVHCLPLLPASRRPTPDHSTKVKSWVCTV